MTLRERLKDRLEELEEKVVHIPSMALLPGVAELGSGAMPSVLAVNCPPAYVNIVNGGSSSVTLSLTLRVPGPPTLSSIPLTAGSGVCLPTSPIASIGVSSTASVTYFYSAVPIAWSQATTSVSVSEGTVSIDGTVDVSVNNTPSVSISGTPTVSISGTPEVEIAADQSVSISGTPAVTVSSGSVDATVSGSVSISGTPSVEISGTPEVEIVGTPDVSISGTADVSIQNASIDVENTVVSSGGDLEFISKSTPDEGTTTLFTAPSGVRSIVMRIAYYSGTTSGQTTSLNVWVAPSSFTVPMYVANGFNLVQPANWTFGPEAGDSVVNEQGLLLLPGDVLYCYQGSNMAGATCTVQVLEEPL